MFIYYKVVLKAEPSRAICSPLPLPFTSRSEDRSIIVAICSHALVNIEKSINRVIDERLLLQSGAKDLEDWSDTRRWASAMTESYQHSELGHNLRRCVFEFYT